MEHFRHYSVLLEEAVEALNCENSDKIFVDGTLGGGGHSELILKRISSNGRLFSFDVDQDAIKFASNRLKVYDNVHIIKDSYVNIKSHLNRFGVDKITGGVIFDFGASYHQLTCVKRGFSFSKEAPLDMRFDVSGQSFCAYDIINSYREEQLVRIFSEYGQEHFSKRIARGIIEYRCRKKIETTLELVNIINKSVGKVNSKINSATKVFQALRIEVNQELKNIKEVLEEVIPILEVGAIIVTISFHSLEDVIVKQIFKRKSRNCNCGPYDMVCCCDKAVLELVNKKPIVASKRELFENPSSRSAKLRIAKRI